LRWCDAGAWVSVSCDTLCASRGQPISNGCGESAVLGGPSCFCDTPLAAPTPAAPAAPAAPARACFEADLACLDDLTLAQCEAGAWQAHDCDALCRAAGYDQAAGCGHDGASRLDACLCEDLPCPVGTEACGDGTCVDAAWVCDGRVDCATADDEAGCGASCYEGDSLCVDADLIEVCEGGAWRAYDCAEVCWQEGYDATFGCGPAPASQTRSGSGFGGLSIDACHCTWL
jgi:hypothetical protein